MNRAEQSGLSMVEILVALLILAIGLIGVAGMEAVSLRNNISALNRSNAIFLTGSIMDRIRTNPDGTYTTTEADGPASPNLCKGTTASCTINQLATAHLGEWKCQLGGYTAGTTCDDIDRLLPDGTGAISFDAASSAYTIVIKWTDTAGFENGARASAGEVVTLTTTLTL